MFLGKYPFVIVSAKHPRYIAPAVSHCTASCLNSGFFKNFFLQNMTIERSKISNWKVEVCAQVCSLYDCGGRVSRRTSRRASTCSSAAPCRETRCARTSRSGPSPSSSSTRGSPSPSDGKQPTREMTDPKSHHTVGRNVSAQTSVQSDVSIRPCRTFRLNCLVCAGCQSRGGRTGA